MGHTLFEKIWQAHLVRDEGGDDDDGAPAVIYADLHLLHDVTSPQAFAELDRRGIGVRRPDLCLATIDHSSPTLPPDAEGNRPYVSQAARLQAEALARSCERHGIEFHGWDSRHRGIVHVIGPEMGATQPGMTIVCGDSHTSTHGAFGTLAFGIGTTEVGHVLASQCLLQRKPATLGIAVEGQLSPGVTAKDVILHIIGTIGVDGGTGHVIEYFGSAIRALDMESRMTLCNMSIESGARAGIIAPDEVTFAYLKGRPKAPTGEAWEQAVARWRMLTTDPDARFDRVVEIDAQEIEPSVTWGTNPGMVIGIGERIPQRQDASAVDARSYMNLQSGHPLEGHHVDVVFIGSCTNSRISDLRAAAGIMRGHRVPQGTRVLVVPGSEQVRLQAEREGLHEVFKDSGAEWRESGCSMCLAMNGDMVLPGELVVSTSNRNFKGRQGRGARTILASPLTAAASAITGRVTDPRKFLGDSF